MDLFQNTDDDDSGMYKTETQAKQNVLIIINQFIFTQFI